MCLWHFTMSPMANEYPITANSGGIFITYILKQPLWAKGESTIVVHHGLTAISCLSDTPPKPQKYRMGRLLRPVMGKVLHRLDTLKTPVIAFKRLCIKPRRSSGLWIFGIPVWITSLGQGPDMPIAPHRRAAMGRSAIG